VADLSKTDDATVLELQQLVPMYDELSLSSKVHLLQSLVSQILVNEIFESYFVGLSDEQANHFRDMEKILLSYSKFRGLLARPRFVSQHQTRSIQAGLAIHTLRSTLEVRNVTLD
jgi:hypothetical protein